MWACLVLFPVAQLAAFGVSVAAWVMGRRVSREDWDPKRIGPFYLSNRRLFEVIKVYGSEHPRSRLPAVFWGLAATGISVGLVLVGPVYTWPKSGH
jgi:hypothetical protein